MIIQGIKIDNIRGKSFDLELDRMNLIVGPNKSGKTTIADSLRFALLGYIPGMPKPRPGGGAVDWSELLGYGISNHARADVTIKTEIGEFKRSIVTQVGGSIKVDPTGPIDAADLDINPLPLDMAGYFEATGPARAEILAACSATDIKWHDLVSPLLRQTYPYGKEPWHTWVNQAIEKAKDKKRDQAAFQAMYAQTVRGLTSMRGLIVPDGSEVKASHAAALEALGKKRHQLGLFEQQMMEARKPQKVSEARKQLDKVETQLCGQKRGDIGYISFEKRCTNNNDAIETLKGKKDFLDAEAYAKANAEYGAASSKQASVMSSLRDFGKKLEEISREYEHLRESGKCPTCGHAGTGFKVNINQLEKEERTEIQAYIDQAQIEAKKITAEHKKLNLKIMRAREINALITEALKEQRNLASEKALIDLWERHDQLAKQVEAEQVTVQNVEDIEQAKFDLEGEIDDLQEEVSKLEIKIKGINDALSQRKQLAEAEEQLAASEKAQSQFAQDIKELDQLRQRFTTMSLEPILEKVRMFTAGIFENDLQLDGSEIGRFVGSKWVSLRQFSGSEQMVATAALTAALCVEGKANYLICDELGTMDDEHLVKFIKNIQTAIGNGVITQFVGFTTPRETNMNLIRRTTETKVIVIG